MKKKQNITIKISPTTYKKILAIQKNYKLRPSIKVIVDFAISKMEKGD